MIQDDPEAPICQPEESRIPVITSTTFLPANNLSRSERDFFFFLRIRSRRVAVLSGG